MRYRIRNVVKFEIQENFSTPINDFTDDLRTAGRKELTSDLEHGDYVVQFAHKLQGLFTRTDIQGDDGFFLHCFICPTISRMDDSFLFSRNFCKPWSTCSGA